MFEVNCLDSNGDSLCLHQWDLNQTVTIEMIGCDETYLQYQPEVHFANINSKEAIVVPAKVKEGTVDTIIADIPNILLTEHYPLFVYIYLFTDTTYANDSLEENEVAHRSQATILRTEIPVLRRVRPSDYNYTQNIERFTAEMIVKDATDKVDVIVADAETSINTTKTEAIESIENIKQEVIDEKKAALTAIDDAEDDALTEVETAKNNAIAELQSAADDTYVNETDIVYDLDSYTIEDNDGKVLSASEGIEIYNDLLNMIEEKTDYFGLSNTDAVTETKVVEVATDNIALKKGTILHVRFSHENTSSKPKLSVNATPAISIQASGTEGAYWQAHQMVTFVYDDQSDMGSDVDPVWQVVSSPVYTNGDIIGNAAEKHIVLTDSDVNDQMRFNYGDVTKMYLDSLGLHIGEDNEFYDKYGRRIANGSYVNGVDIIDPDTTDERLVVTDINVPDDDVGRKLPTLVSTYGNNDKAKSQIAIPWCSQWQHVHYRCKYYPDGSEEPIWSDWIKLAEYNEVQYAIENAHIPSRVTNSVYKKTIETPKGDREIKGDRSLVLVYDTIKYDGKDVGCYFLRPSAAKEAIKQNEASEEAATFFVTLGSVGYPYRNIHTQFLRVYHSDADADANNVAVSVQGVTQTQNIRPSATDKYYCGGSTGRWAGIYCKSGTISTSDINSKHDIETIDDKYIELFDLIQPYKYYFNNGDRVHTGFISQYVEEAMEKVGLSAEELAFFCKDIEVETVLDENGEIVEVKEVYDEDGNLVYVYSLRYEEYIAIMTEKIKRMEKKHEEEIASLQTQIDELKAIVLNK